MTIVKEARSALQTGASTVLSTVRRRPKTSRRLAALRPQKLMKRVNRRFGAKRSRRALILPIALSVGATAAGVTAGIIMRRYLAAKEIDKEEVATPYTREEIAVAD